jgi:beta-lactamase regulating signal transducer with metallopeptidase domain
MTTFPVLLFVRGALVLALALVALRLLRRAPAALRHAVLVSALVAVLSLPALRALLPTWHTGAIATPSARVETPALPVPDRGGVPLASPPSAMSAAPVEASVPWDALLLGVWAGGAVLLLLRAADGAVRARRLAARGTRLERHDAGSVRVVVSDEIEAPIVVGALAPVIVVPRSSEEWSASHWRVVLQHELAHVHRRDAVANLIAQVACAAYWFDPLVWVVARRMREERELAADDAVLRDGTRASTYAEHLLEIATNATRAPAGAIAMADGARLEARVVALLDGTRSHKAAGARAIAIAACASVVAVTVACLSPLAAAPVNRKAPTAAKPTGALQTTAEAELDRVIAAQRAKGAVAIVLDAKTGAVRALAARGTSDASAARSPGSTMKPFTFAAALEADVVTPASRIDCERGQRAYGDKVLRDAAANGVLDLAGILAVSSNVCTAKIAEAVGDKLGTSLRRFHLPAPEQIDTRSLDGAAMAIGEGIRLSPLELAAGYTAFANDGVYVAPDGTRERVMRAETARGVMTMLEGVVTGANGTGHAAQIRGVRVAGKTGTAQTSIDGKHYASFIGIVPADAPKFIVLVGVDGVDGAGGTVAAPVFAKLAARALAGS